VLWLRCIWEGKIGASTATVPLRIRVSAWAESCAHTGAPPTMTATINRLSIRLFITSPFDFSTKEFESLPGYSSMELHQFLKFPTSVR
jgi:hypothetical protein